MDFIVGLPKLGNKSVIMVVVDRLSKYAHFYALQHPFSLILFFFITTQLSPAIFGKKISSYKAPNCISTQLINPRMMVKLNLSKKNWKHILCVLHRKGKLVGSMVTTS
jgi:hypothetical protein